MTACGLCGLPSDTCGGWDDHVHRLAEDAVGLRDTRECEYEGYHECCLTHEVERSGFIAIGPDDDLKLYCPHDVARRLVDQIIKARAQLGPPDSDPPAA